MAMIRSSRSDILGTEWQQVDIKSNKTIATVSEKPLPPPPEERKWYENPWVIGGGAGVVVVAGIVYAKMQK